MKSIASISSIELIRHAVLLQLNAVYPTPIPASTLDQGLKIAGHMLSASALHRELSYLKDKQLLSAEPSLLDPTVRRYRLTATGEDYLHSQGLIG